MTLPIPESALNQHLAILGKTGSGKSYATRGLVERLLDDGHRVCILDYTGVWHGLRSSVSGKRAAYPVVIFGGEHADVPLTEQAGPAVAKFVAGGSRPCIIDLDGMTVGQQQRFVTAFAEELYRLNSDPLHLVLEEIDEFAPQTGAPGAERMIGAICRIFQRGRRKGFRAIAITQRPANLHKRVLTQCNALVTLRLVAPQDRKAISEWIRGHADDETGRKVVDSLPKLARGEGWVWAPEQDVLERVKFPAIKTFDTMQAPEDGQEQKATGWAEVDLDAIRSEMASAVAEAEANDPKKLKAEIAALRRELVAAGKSVDPVKMEDAERRSYARGHADGVVDGRSGALSDVVAFCQSTARPSTTPKTAPSIKAQQLPAKIAAPVAKKDATATNDLTGPERALLASLAWWQAVGQSRPSRAMVCAIAGWRVTSGHVKNVSGSLRSKGLIEYPTDGRVALTDDGASAAEPPDDTGRSIAGFVRDTLTGPQTQVFDELIRHPNGLDRASLCEAIGWNVTSGHVKNVLGSMRSMEIVEYPTQGSVKLVDWILE